MRISNIKKLAMATVFSLGIVSYSGMANAAAFEMDGTGLTIPVVAAVDNTTDVDFDQIDFETIGVTSDAVDTATLVMLATGVITDDLGAGVGGTGEAHIVSDDDAGSEGEIRLTAAFPAAQIFSYYSNLTDLDCALCPNPANPDLILEQVLDNLATPGSYTASTSTQVTGIGTTGVGGDLTWQLGATLMTVATTERYETGNYAGSFDLILTY